MDSFSIIKEKLESFIKRYYTNELLKGAILFFAIGVLYFLLTLFIEHILWLDPLARTFLFWLFIAVELVLLAKFIVLPLAKLFKLQKGIDYKGASLIIGKHFPEVNDKLLNVLQLHQSSRQSELLLASIEQKSLELKPVPFKLAVNYGANIKYLKYAMIPVLVILAVTITGNLKWFSDSYERVVHYKMAYVPPAPFQFFILNKDLTALENKDYTLSVKTVGDIVPENVQVVYSDEVYIMQQTGIGSFAFKFSSPKTDIEFRLKANNIESRQYKLDVVKVPAITSFDMILDYPAYTNKNSDRFMSTGNAIVPEGTRVTWELRANAAEHIHLYAKDTVLFALSDKGVFNASKRVFSNFEYTLSASNEKLPNYENLAFTINVVKDEYPEMKLRMVKDSVDLQTLYFYGQVSDDYGFSKLQLVYYPSGNEEDKHFESIPFSNSNISEFISAFPNGLSIQPGIPYELYFEVFDNDAVNRYKSVKSNVFSYRKRTGEEEVEKQLGSQKETIQDLNKAFEKLNEQDKKLMELTNTQKEKTNLSFNDKKKIEAFLKRQKQQDEMMKHFNEKLKDNLENLKDEHQKEDLFKKDLEQRLKENEDQLKRDEELLKELEKLQEKINKEELVQKLEQLAKQNKNKKRSLEQLLELTKRFYVQKKLERLKEDLAKQAIEQEKLSNTDDDDNTKEKQEALNKEFDDFKKSLEELKQESDKLKKPIDIPQDKLDEREIDQEQDKASESLEKKEQESSSEGDGPTSEEKRKEELNKAKQSQKKAAKKMMKMSQNMAQSMMSGGGDQMQEDIEMLRQILDNLVLFSFDQEALMEQFKTIEENHNKYATFLRKQNSLREHFEHIDDSLFALSLRNPKLSETVNKEINEVFFNIDKSLGQLSENQIYQGVASQQFAVTSANNLADFLSDVLDNMQENMSLSPGQGGKGEMQLPDIIMSQEELNKKMEQGLKEGEQNKGESRKGKEGEEEGEDGEKDGKGREGNTTGEGDGDSERMNGALYEIYQEQQRLRQALEEKLIKEGGNGDNNRLLKEMEHIELELLNKGFTNQTLRKMMNLQHQLLKLDNATFQQGKDNKRESETNNTNFDGVDLNQIQKAKQYFQTTEILNRQTLPLQQLYKKKVQLYFKQRDD
ncbi:hypothetical protein [Snuella sedimenti]|uniref:DUF4175 family protein n=1 Tax=Snuella sedimenti TaxID=2798802 RepID=A0A8J7J4B0_9FLAO|nr:hypothetical protein [Snuella sedimenti]MBJ6368459.1 hypothetical protein [Snuella sedimenti]